MISQRLLRPRLAELGRIKIGGRGEERRTAAGKTMRLPVKYDSFVCTTRHRGADDNFVRDEQVHAKVGPAPTELDIRLPFELPEENFHSELCQYRGRQKIWVCDGQVARNLQTGQAGSCVRQKGATCKCKPYARLAVMLEQAPQTGGLYVFRTTSWETTTNIQTALMFFYEAFGSLRGLPLRLVLYPATDSYTEGGEVRESTSYKVGLVLRHSIEEAAEAVVSYHQHQQVARSQVRLLAAALSDELAATDEAEAAELAEEFWPDPGDISSVHTQERIDTLKDDLGLGTEPASQEPEPSQAADAYFDVPVVCPQCGAQDWVSEVGLESLLPCSAGCGGTMVIATDPPLEPVVETAPDTIADLQRLFWLRWHENCPIADPKDRGDRCNWQLRVTGKSSQSNWKEEHYRKAIAALTPDETPAPDTAEEEDDLDLWMG